MSHRILLLSLVIGALDLSVGYAEHSVSTSVVRDSRAAVVPTAHSVFAAQPPALPTFHRAVAILLKCNVSQCPDPECAAARIAQCHPRVTRAFLEAFYAQMRLTIEQDTKTTFMQIQQVAHDRQLLIEENSAIAHVGLADARILDARFALATAMARLQRSLCSCNTSLALPTELAPITLKYTLAQLIAMKPCCKRLIAARYATYTAHHDLALTLFNSSVPSASSALAAAIAGIQPNVSSCPIFDAVQVTLTAREVRLAQEARLRLADLSAFELEQAIGRCIFTK